MLVSVRKRELLKRSSRNGWPLHLVHQRVSDNRSHENSPLSRLEHL